MPSSCSRISAADSRCSRIRSPALSWTTRSWMESHSGVAYSGWEPTSRYRRAPFSRNTLDDRPHDTTRRKRYRATSSGLSRRWPRNVHVTPYSFSRPKMRRSIFSKGMPVARERRELPGEDPGDLLVRETSELPALGSGPIEHACLDLVVGDLTLLRHGAQCLHGRADRRREIPAFLEPIAERVGQLLGMATDRDEPLFVRDGSVEQDVVDARCPRSPINLADHDLDLVGLHLLGEDGGERLRVRVGEVTSFDVFPPVLIAAEIRESDTRDAELLELGVLADPGECDP